GDGQVWAYLDDTTAVAPSFKWNYAGVLGPVSTAPVLDDANGKVYVGSSNGYVAQLNASTGLVEADRHLCDNFAVSDLTLDVATPVVADLSRLMAPQVTRAARLCIPWPLATSGDIGCSTVGVATPQPRATALGPPRPNPLHGSTRLVFHLA